MVGRPFLDGTIGFDVHDVADSMVEFWSAFDA